MATDVMQRTYGSEARDCDRPGNNAWLRIATAVLTGVGAFCLAGFAVSTIVYYADSAIPESLRGQVLPVVVGIVSGVIVAFHELRKIKL